MNDYRPRNVGVELVTAIFRAIWKGIKKIFK
jgi:hypothetical protein